MANLALMVVAFAAFFTIVTSFATTWLDGTSAVAEGFRVARAMDAVNRRASISETSDCINPLGTSTEFVIVNGGQAPLRNFEQWSLVARYLTSSGTNVEALTYTSSASPSDDQWTVDEIRLKNGPEEVFGPGIIDPGEEATITVKFSPGVWASTANSVSLTTDTGSVAVVDFTGVNECGYYLHNNPTPPTGNTNQQANLTADSNFPGQATLYNYDQDRDSSAGRLIVKGGSGAAESDLTKYQNWRTGALGEDLKLSGTVRVNLWAAMKDFNTAQAGVVKVFLRDYNGASYVEIANGTASSTPWDAGASGTWVSKAITVSAVNYTVPAGNQLEVKVIVDSASANDMWFAYDTVSYYTNVEIPAVVTLNFHSEDRPIAAARYNQLRLAAHDAGYYLHNNPTPPIQNTNAQANLTATQVFPNATTIRNYDADQDAVNGRRITRGGSGASEGDLPQYQNWRLPAVARDTTIEGTVRFDFWSAVGSFSTSLGGDVTLYLRDYNPSSGLYTEIASATLAVTPWDAAASGTWVRRFVEVASVDYTLVRGRQLEVKLIVNNGAGADMHFAYDTTSYASTLLLPGAALETDPEGKPVTQTVTPGAGIGRVRLPTNEGRWVFPLDGYTRITDAIWTVTYRVKREAYGFKWFTAAYDITPGTQNQWVDIDLSAYLPTTATGAVIEIYNLATGATRRGVVRGTADTRDYAALYVEDIGARNHRYQIVKVDGDRKIQGYNTRITDVKFRLTGYTIGDDPLYFDVPPDITPLPAVWSDIDVSSYVDSDATGVILLIDNGGAAAAAYGVREVGSTFIAVTRTMAGRANTMYVVGLDANKKFQAYLASIDLHVFLVGQTKQSLGFYTDDVAVTDPAIGAWEQIDADTYNVPAAASGLILYAYNGHGTIADIAFRHGDSADNFEKRLTSISHFQGAAALNSSNIWDEYMGHPLVDVSIAAYTVLVEPVDADVHADMDILIRKSNGEIRTTLATNVANTATIPTASWVTMTATTTLSEYVIVDPTDYLEIDLFADVTRNDDPASAVVHFRFDDNALPPEDRTSISNVGLYRE